MCKILCIAGLKPEKWQKNMEFITEAGFLMSKNNDDGLGYTAVDDKGELFGERWLENEEAFRIRAMPTKLSKKYGDFIDVEDKQRYGNFGKVDYSKMKAITLHTRFATSPKGFNNVHPFVDLEHKTSIIHNGGINNHCKADEIRSTCDSERVLNMYLKHGIGKNVNNFQNFIDDLKGYFACGIFSVDNKNKTILDIFKSRAQLHGALIYELDAVVFCTDLNVIKTAAQECDLTIVNTFKVNEDVLCRMDALTGEVILNKKYRDTANSYYHTPNNRGTTNDPVNKYLADERDDPYTPEEVASMAAKAEERNKTTATQTEIEEARSIMQFLSDDEALKQGYIRDGYKWKKVVQ